MISTEYSYAVHGGLKAHVDMVNINRFAWKSLTNAYDLKTTFIDAHTYQPVPDDQRDVYVEIVGVLDTHGVRVLRNDHGRLSMQLEVDGLIPELNIWYHLTDKTGSVSLSTVQAPWDDVNDRLDLAAGVLISIDPASVAQLAEKVDGALRELVPRLLKLKEDDLTGGRSSMLRT